MGLDQIVNVTVTRETRAPLQAGFGVPLLAAYHTAWPDRAKLYLDPADMLDDGFTESDPVYNQAVRLQSQDPSVDRFVIGRRANAPTQTINWTPEDLTVGFVHSLTIDGTAYTYEVQTSDTVALIVDGMLSAIAGASGVTGSDETTHLEIEADVAGVLHTFSTGRGANLLDITADPGLAADLNAIRQATDLSPSLGWYGLLLDSNSAAEIEVAATWCETNTAQLFVQSADWNIKDSGETDDIASDLQGAAFRRTAGIYHDEIGSWAATALMSQHLAYQPGIATMAHKTLIGPAPVGLTGGEKLAIEAKNWSTYTEVAGFGRVFEGKTPAGEFVDIVRDIDFSTARIQEAVFGALSGNPKVPFTDTGIETIKAQVRSALMLCSSADHPIFDRESIEVTAPTVAETQTADRANRLLRPVRYTARLQGAIHRVEVRGRVLV